MALGQHDSLADRTLMSMAVNPASLSGATNGSAIDMQGWDGCCFVISIGAITGAGSLDAKVQSDDNSGFNSATDITNAALTQVVAATNNNVAVIDVYRPTERYLRLVLTQAVNTVLAGATAIRYRRSGILPPTQSAVQVVRLAQN